MNERASIATQPALARRRCRREPRAPTRELHTLGALLEPERQFQGEWKLALLRALEQPCMEGGHQRAQVANFHEHQSSPIYIMVKVTPARGQRELVARGIGRSM